MGAGPEGLQVPSRAGREVLLEGLRSIEHDRRQNTLQNINEGRAAFRDARSALEADTYE